MERREMLGVLGASAAGLVAMSGGNAPAQGQQSGGQGRQGHSIMDECARVCNETAAHCLHQAHQGGNQNQGVHLKAHEATMDCQAFCHLTSALMARKSPYSAYAHQACADACRDCAAACDKGQDETMKRCADVCRRCEEHCRRQAKQGSGSR
jgi:hypothetical protein